MNPLISIAIPTHNRARYAVHAIRSLLAIPDQRLQVVVSDTSTDGELTTLILRGDDPVLRDSRLKYFRPDRQLDMTGNHNFAIAKATGDYICLIGDDDTVSSEIMDATQWALENGIELIAPNVVANYAWPDFRSRHFGNKHSSRLYFAKQMGAACFRDSEKALISSLRNAAQGTDGLPKIYHGIVKRSVLETIRELSGAYFHGSSPDVSGAIGLALCSKRFVVVDYPLTIPGASGGSNTGRSAMNQHKGRLSQESQTKAFEKKGWSPGVPRFFSVETVWAHAALETISKISPEMLSSFNFARLIAVCIVLHPEYLPEINAAIAEAEEIVGGNPTFFDRQVKREMTRFRRDKFLHVLKRLLRPTAAGGRAYVSGIETIAAAPAALRKHMSARGLEWEQVTAGLPRSVSIAQEGSSTL